MEIIYISSLDETRKNLYISSLSSFLSKDYKVLIINFGNNRNLEIKFGIEDYIIYDNLDYFSGNCDFNQGIIELNDNLYIMPSAYKNNKYYLQDKDYYRIKDMEEYDFIILNGYENILKYFTEIANISDNLLESRMNYYINNTNISKKLNYKILKQIEDKGVSILGEVDITSIRNEEELNNIWEVYTGSKKYIYEKTIIERIFTK